MSTLLFLIPYQRPAAKVSEALDLVELLKQQQQAQLILNNNNNQQQQQDANNKQLGVLQCVAKLPPSSQTSPPPQQQQQQQLASPSPAPSPPATHDHHHHGPQVVIIPSGQGDSSGGDESPPTHENNQLEPPSPVDDVEELPVGGDDQDGAPAAAPVPADHDVEPADQLNNELGDESAAANGADYDQMGAELEGGLNGEVEAGEPPPHVADEDQAGGTGNASSSLFYHDRRRNSSRRSVGSNWHKLNLFERFKPRSLRRPRLVAAPLHPSNSERRLRFKRQATDTGSQAAGNAQQAQQFLASSLAQLITRALIQQRQQRLQRQQLLPNLLGLQQQQQSPTNQNNQAQLFQTIVSALLPVGTTLASNLLIQSVDDLPVRMANMGQLLANLLTTLTVNNPMLVNEPLLARTRSLATGANQTLENPIAPLTSVLANVVRALLLPPQSLSSSTPTSPAQPVQPTTGAGETAPPTTTPSFEPTVPPSLEPDQTQPPLETNLQEAASQQSKSVRNSTSRLNESDFLEHLNALTLGQVSRKRDGQDQTTLETEKSRKKPSGRINGKSKNKTNIESRSDKQQEQRKQTSTPASTRSGRSKRSLGAMLMFGPFSKFYVAMALHRMMRYQSGVLSQAIMGELVRRYIIPSFSSALGGGGGGSGAAGANSASALATSGQQATTLALANGNPSQQFLNTARQALLRAGSSALGMPPPIFDLQQQQLLASGSTQHHQVASDVNQTLRLAPMVQHQNQDPAPFGAGQQLKLQQELLLAQMSSPTPTKAFAAECQFVQNNQNQQRGDEGAFASMLDPIRFTAPIDYAQLMQLLQSPMAQMFAAALKNPPISFDREARQLSINLPISQTSMSLPTSLLGGQQALFRMLAANMNPLHGAPDLRPLNRTRALRLHRPHSARFWRQPHSQTRIPLRNLFPHPMAPSGVGPIDTQEVAQEFPLPPEFGVSGEEQLIGPPPPPFDFSQVNELEQASLPINAAGANLSELLKQASPAQLLGLLSKMNVTGASGNQEQQPQRVQKVVSSRTKNTKKTKSKSAQDSVAANQLELIQKLLASALKPSTKNEEVKAPVEEHESVSASRVNATATPVKLQSPDALADELLNKTLSIWADQLLQDGPTAGGRLDDGGVVSSNTSISAKKVQAPRGAGEQAQSGGDKSEQRNIQITLTADNAANLMEKLVSKLTTSKPQAAIALTNDSQPFSATPSGDQEAPLRREPLRSPMAAMRATSAQQQQRHVDFDGVEQVTQQRTNATVPDFWPPGGLQEDEEVPLPRLPPPPPPIHSDDDNFISIVYAGDQQQQQQQRRHSFEAPPSMQTHRRVHDVDGSLRKLRQEASGVSLNSRREQSLAATNEEVAPQTGSAVKLNGARELKQVSTLSQPFTASGLVTQFAAAATTNGSGPTEQAASGQQKIAKSDNKREPLNNLAMALNVMNMVMLNQRLMAATNNASSTTATPPPPPPPIALVGPNLLLATSAAEQAPPAADQRRRPTLGLAGKFAPNAVNSVALLPKAHRVQQLQLQQQQQRIRLMRKKQMAATAAADGPRTRAKSTTQPSKPYRLGGQPARRPQEAKPADNSTTPVGATSAAETSSMGPSATSTSGPDFELLNRNDTVRSAPKQNRTNLTLNSNHRTSTNAIRLHSNLIHANKTSGATNGTTGPKVVKYVYQPLIVNSPATSNSSANDQPAISPTISATNSSVAEPRQVFKDDVAQAGAEMPSLKPTVAAAAANTQSATERKVAQNESTESENDHAARWNDVLQHLNFSA